MLNALKYSSPPGPFILDGDEDFKGEPVVVLFFGELTLYQFYILANKIIRLLKDPKYRKYLGDNGKKLIQPLASLDLLANDWINIAERAIKNENAPLLKVDVYDLLRNLQYGTFKLFFKNKI